MNARKDRLRSLFAGEDADETASPSPAPAPPAPAPPAPAPLPPKRTSSGAVKAMGLSLGALSQEAEEARRLRQQIASGEQIVELDPALLDRSPYLDRLSNGGVHDEDFEALKRSMAEHGQQVPILVRPHPDKDRTAQGFYQIAYGHRRVQAARELGRPVRALVRPLDNSELALAQGKENAERRGLSFIERAFFAKTLLDNGFDRNMAQAALAVHKSELSRLIQVVEAIPYRLMVAIGPAPKAGRPRWMALGDLISKDVAGHAESEIGCDAFKAADSDARFQRLYSRLKASSMSRNPAKPKDGQIKDSKGNEIGRLARSGGASRLTFASAAGDGFAEFVAGRLPELHAAFRAGSKDK